MGKFVVRTSTKTAEQTLEVMRQMHYGQFRTLPGTHPVVISKEYTYEPAAKLMVTILQDHGFEAIMFEKEIDTNV